MSTISTHVLDTSVGKPAAGVPVLLARIRDKGDDARDLRGVTIGAGTTDEDGRLRDFVTAGAPLAAGPYRPPFDAAEYSGRTGLAAFYPAVAAFFRVGEKQEHYHIPLLINAFGYTTYRGR